MRTAASGCQLSLGRLEHVECKRNCVCEGLEVLVAMFYTTLALTCRSPDFAELLSYNSKGIVQNRIQSWFSYSGAGCEIPEVNRIASHNGDLPQSYFLLFSNPMLRTRVSASSGPRDPVTKSTSFKQLCQRVAVSQDGIPHQKHIRLVRVCQHQFRGEAV